VTILDLWFELELF